MARPKNPMLETISGRVQKPVSNPFDLEPLDLVPVPDKYMKQYQREFFMEVCTALVEAKQLRSIDVRNVEIAGFWYQMARTAMEMIDKNTYVQTAASGWEQTSPHVAALEKATRMLQSFADRYGLNLTSKTKIPKAKSDKHSLKNMFDA